MTIIQNAATAVALSLCALSPLVATANTRTPVTARIATADLDLTRPAGRASLHRRLVAAARLACNRSNARWTEMADAQRCYREMMADGDRKIAGLSGQHVVELARLDPR